MFSLLNKEVKNLIVFDLEWNQSSFHTNHRIPHEIIEIGALKVRDGKVEERFMEFIRPCQPVSKTITDLTGITNEMVADAEDSKTVIPAFLEFCGNDVLVGRVDSAVMEKVDAAIAVSFGLTGSHLV